jgi:HAD superfamily hydrolase (TIGR01484 family)
MNRKLRPHASELVLASDLDGTLIPLAENPRNLADLAILTELLSQHAVPLAYVTGRHLASVEQARTQYKLPRPDWIICDVGTSIYQLDNEGPPQPVASYQEHLAEFIAALPMPALKELIGSIRELRLQEAEKLGPFKLSYYADAEAVENLVVEIEQLLKKHAAPYSLIASVDPFNGDGLIDLLPRGVSKAHALDWWSDHTNHQRQSIVFAGDSGNDVAALTAGFRAIVVGNADRKVPVGRRDRASAQSRPHSSRADR